MKKSNWFLSLVLIATFLFTAPSLEAASICELNRCPNGVSETNVCFLDPDVTTGFIKLGAYRSCGYLSDKFIIRDKDDYSKVFNQLAKSCKRIKHLYFFGHGSPNYIGAGQLDRDSLRTLSKYNCLMKNEAQVHLVGCNTGRSCLGQLQMAAAAETFLPHGGRVYGNTYYSSTIVPGLMAHIPLSLFFRRLDYKPGSPSQQAWSKVSAIQGPEALLGFERTGASENPKQNCIYEIDQAVKETRELSCLDSQSRNEILSTFSQIKNRLSRSADSSVAGVVRAFGTDRDYFKYLQSDLTFDGNYFTKIRCESEPSGASRARTSTAPARNVR